MVVGVAGAASPAHVLGEAAALVVGPHVPSKVLQTEVAVGLDHSLRILYSLLMRPRIPTVLGRAKPSRGSREVRAAVVEHGHESFRRPYKSHGLRLRRGFSADR